MSSVILSLQARSQQVTDLNPVTVTATRGAQQLSGTGRSMVVLDGKLFRQLPVNSIDELLKYVPGVEVQQRGPAGSQSDVVIRGGTFQQVLVLIDGVKINDPVTGHFSSYTPIAPYEIERIEVLKGPAAALYGSEAVGGVINIISKTFNSFKEEKKLRATAGLSAGEYGFRNTDLGFYHTAKDVNLSAGWLSNNADGQLLRGNNRGFFYNNTVSASANIKLSSKWQLSLRSAFDSRRFAAQNFYTTFVSDTATEKVNSWWNQVQLRHKGNKSSDEVSAAYKQTSDHYLYNPKSIANDNKSNFVLLQYLHLHQLNTHWNIQAGALFDNRSIRSNDRGNHNTSRGAVFAGAQYILQNLRINPSLRVDMDGNYGTELLPQLNMVYQWKPLYFRLNVGRAIRSADFTERYNNYGKALVTGGSIGNPDLSAERSWSYEAGADLFFSNFKLSGTYFIRDQDNLVDWVTTPYADMPRKDNLAPGGTYALARNIKSVKTNGVEFDLTWQRSFAGRHQLYLNAGATFLHSSSSDAAPSFYIVSHAKTLVQGNIIYNWKGFGISLNALYKERNGQAASGINAYISRDYWLFNGRIQYSLGRLLQVYIATSNIGNESYSDLLGSRMPGRWTTGGFRLNFN